MVREAPIPRTAAGRPPTFAGPPIGTTFSNDPDDRDDMLTYLRDNVTRLVRQAEHADRSHVPQFMRLLDQRRDWIRGELSVEGMLQEPPKAPLGIPDNLYDLAALTREPIDERQKTYEHILDLIDRTMGGLWERMLEEEESA